MQPAATAKIKIETMLTLFHDCKRSLVLPGVLRVCALFEGLREFCFVFRFVFCATLLDFTSRTFATTIRIDFVMRPRSSSRRRNTSASVTVTVTAYEEF